LAAQSGHALKDRLQPIAKFGSLFKQYERGSYRRLQGPIALWESDRLPAIDLPVANAMNEKAHGRSMHRNGIQD
jgi:hypothetical protein